MTWAIIEGYEEYSINESGIVMRTVSKKGATSGKKLKIYLDSKGYPQVCLCKNSKSKKFRIHRLLANAYIPNPLIKPCVNHIDGNRENNSLKNLEWVTRSENTLHGYHVSKNMKAPSLGKLGKYKKKPNYFSIEYPSGKILKFGSTHECFIKTGIDHTIICSAKKRGLKTYEFIQGKVKGLIVHFELVG